MPSTSLTMNIAKKSKKSTKMVQRVISGKINTGGLLKQKKKNYNEIAVNKLLDVLRKDTTIPPIEEKKTITTDDDDDWIGGKADDLI